VLTLPKQILLCLPHSSSKLACSLAEARFLLESREAEVVRNASEVYQYPEVGLGVDCLPFRYRIHKNRFFTVPVIMALPADRDSPPPRRLKTALFHGLPFCIRLKIMDPSAITIRDKKRLSFSFKTCQELGINSISLGCVRLRGSEKPITRTPSNQYPRFQMM